jgi:hypothetical protein
MVKSIVVVTAAAATLIPGVLSVPYPPTSYNDHGYCGDRTINKADVQAAIDALAKKSDYVQWDDQKVIGPDSSDAKFTIEVSTTNQVTERLDYSAAASTAQWVVDNCEGKDGMENSQ